MNKDLEEQLNEMGPEYRAVVARIRAGLEAKGREDFRRKTRDVRGRETEDGRRNTRPRVLRLSSQVLRPMLVAASLLVLLGLGVIFLRPEGIRRETLAASGSATGGREYLLAIAGNEASMREMIATQNSDGSWQNDFLTRRNAASLKLWGERYPAAQIAYKKAMRNVRTRGVL